jgi:hypothetical protein
MFLKKKCFSPNFNLLLIDRSTKRLSKTLRPVNIGAAAGNAARFAAAKLSVNWRCQGPAPVVPERPVARP